jgi:hypothetical protein
MLSEDDELDLEPQITDSRLVPSNYLMGENTVLDPEHAPS